MHSVTAFVEIAGAVMASVALAIGLEWLSLSWLMRAMPGRSRSDIEKRR